jgi:hypothetical protein
MNSLVKELIKNFLPEEEKKQITALYAGGFKPPTAGHFAVVQEALKQNPEIDEFIIFVGSKERDGVSQDESLLIWEIYNKYLPFKVKIEPSSVPPVKAVYDFAKNHPTREVLWILGAREENEQDFIDISSRTKSITNYPNIEVRTIITKGGVSGTAARNASKVSFEKFEPFVPSVLTPEEKQEVYQIVSDKIQENTYTLDIPKFNYPKTLTENLWSTLNEITLSKDNAVKINGNLTGGDFKVGNITYIYAINSIINPYKDGGKFYNISFYPEDNISEKPLGSKENYVKVLSTMFKIISDFAEKEKPEYIGIAAMDNDGSKNYHKVYANLTDNRFNNLPGYFRKDVSLEFNTFGGKGRFVVLKRKQDLKENASYSNHIDYKQKIKALTKHMLDKGMNIVPLPKVVFKHGDAENAKQFLGKTAYYNPETTEIVLYTEGRHPKDIVRSFSHEMVHHIQNLEGRLGNVATTNTLEDDYLDKLEQEANLNGTMTFRNWTDSLQETLLEEEDKLMAEVVNPDGDYFSYQELNPKGLFVYEDSQDNLYFARIFYQSTSTPYFEFKAGWFEDNDMSKPKYDPQLPPNVMGMDNLKRRNTIAKIYRDEIIPYFKEKSSLSNTLIINPISDLRYTFSKRLVQNHTPKDFSIQYDDENKKFIKILSKSINEAIVGNKVVCDGCGWSWNIEDGGKDVYLCHKCGHDNTPLQEKKSKDPFGLNAYAMELARLREEETEYTIYCDMDSVLVDFDLGYQELTGMTTQQADANGVEAFWDPISKAGAKFWITLQWMPDGKQLWDYIKKYNPILLSAPSREESSKLGKRVWVKRELPGVKLILKYASQKQEYASPTSILIDDRQKNIDQWEAAGGIGILHTSTPNTIKQLQQLGL